MRLQDYAIEATRQAVDELLRDTRGVPADKLAWRPVEHARSVMEILQECATTPAMVVSLLKDRPQAPQNVQESASAPSLETIDQCEQVLRANTETLCETIQNLSDDDLNQMVVAPWEQPYTIAQAMFLHYWNTVYHLGQVAYIQTLYGDMNYY